jgi:sulfite reductase alpha subunit-like flavoprotein
MSSRHHHPQAPPAGPLAAVVADRSGRSPADAEAYLRELKRERRYQRDVY